MKIILFLLLAVGVFTGVYTAVQNDASEWGWRDVEISVAFEEVRQLAREANLAPAEILLQLRSLGVTAVAMREAEVRRYVYDGTLTAATGSQIVHSWRLTGGSNSVLLPLLEGKQIQPNATYLLLEDKALAERLVRKAELKLQKPVRVRFARQPLLIEIDEDLDLVLGLRIGLDPDDVALLRQAGLRLVPRPENAFLTSEAAVRETLSEFFALPAESLSAIMFDGPEVTGYPDHLAAAAEAIRESGQALGIVEFAKRPAGISQLSALVGYQTILIHPNQPGRPVQSIVNSVQERRVRLVHIRLPLDEANPLAESLALLESVTESLSANGYRGAPARAVSLPGHEPLQLLLMLLGLAAAAALLVYTISRRETCLPWLVFIAAFAALMLLFPLFSVNVALQVGSVLAALLFSILAVVSQQLNRLPSPAKDNITALSWALITMCRTFLLVAAGGALVAALPSTPYFAGGTALFRGVKLVHVLPLVVLLPLAISRIYYSHVTDWTPARLTRVISDFLSSPIKIIYLLSLLILVTVGFLYVARTGNVPGVPVLALELHLRELLDSFLVVRPRFKEFLFAYPAALLGLTLLARGSRSAMTTALVVIGAIAPISMANTFMHFTTPTAFYSALFRSFNGLWTGVVVGLILYGIFIFITRVWENKVKML
ncbi:MAG: hypothetical protein KGZ54_11070 [Dethiobacter sp.]|jgi:hypothetical protein|nr:hypothetical protein [Dethiobacter sp.]MBS3902540.1 hypothetical protein [Dethiobacter sp.]